MYDIFISHAIEDRETAAKLTAVLREQHWSVWWYKYKAIPGSPYTELMMEELKGAKVVVVLWSRAAQDSWLVNEVLKRVRQTPVLVLLENVELQPVNISLYQPFTLFGWDGSSQNPESQNLVHHLHALIAARTPTATLPASLEELSLLEIKENARRGINENAAARPEGETRFGGVFISYRRDEAAAYARGLYDRLAAHFGREKIFFDMVNVGVGEDFVDVITEAAESCAVMIVLVSRQWARGPGHRAESDDYVRLEVAKALGRRIRVIPILIQDARMPTTQELPEDLAPLVRRNAHPLTDARWERDVEDLIKTLEGLLKS